jgi:hypothetical protein
MVMHLLLINILSINHYNGKNYLMERDLKKMILNLSVDLNQNSLCFLLNKGFK